MDLSYLLFLQDIRSQIDPGITNFLLEVTNLITSFWTFAILAFVYWVVNQKSGFITVIAFSFSRVLLNLVKLTACVYRPWIRDANIIPDEIAKKGATGYSFPSGHAVTATSLFGSIAYSLWKKIRWISVFLIIFILIVGFSRNYLDVYTPQDVLVAMLLGTVMIFLAPKIAAFLDKLDNKKANVLFIVALFFVVLYWTYITYKSYPIDYIDGELLVDPEAMKNDGYTGVGEFLGVVVGWYINFKFIKYKSSNSKIAIAIALVGLVFLYYFDTCFTALFSSFMDKHTYLLIIRCLKMLYILVIIPCLIKHFDKKYISLR